MNQADTMQEVRQHILNYEATFLQIWAKGRQFPDGTTRWLEGDVADWLECEPSELTDVIFERLASHDDPRALFPTLSECDAVQFWVDEPQILLLCIGCRTRLANFVRFVVAEIFALTPETRLELQHAGYPFAGFLGASEICRAGNDSPKEEEHEY